jgi:hypothetical protein
VSSATHLPLAANDGPLGFQCWVSHQLFEVYDLPKTIFATQFKARRPGVRRGINPLSCNARTPISDHLTGGARNLNGSAFSKLAV